MVFHARLPLFPAFPLPPFLQRDPAPPGAHTPALPRQCRRPLTELQISSFVFTYKCIDPFICLNAMQREFPSVTSTQRPNILILCIETMFISNQFYDDFYSYPRFLTFFMPVNLYLSALFIEMYIHDFKVDGLVVFCIFTRL